MVGGTLKPVKTSPGPSRSTATTFGAPPKPAFSTRTVQVTVSKTPASCMIGFFVTTRSGTFTVRNSEPSAVRGVPGGCSNPVRLKICPDTASQLISRA